MSELPHLGRSATAFVVLSIIRSADVSRVESRRSANAVALRPAPNYGAS